MSLQKIFEDYFYSQGCKLYIFEQQKEMGLN